ncbi:MAG TPA: adenosine deaminase [Lapillicoccus sp.]|nr:adenosine deaminase [Lapillicoccus sp.]
MEPEPEFAELHVHLEGTLEPELIFALAARNGVRLPYRDVEDLRSRYAFSDLQSFLDLYYPNLQVLQTEQDFADLTEAYLRRARQGGVRHAEVFLDVQAHTARGIPAEVALAGVTDALARSEELGLTSGLIVTMLRHLPAESAMLAYEQVCASGLPFLGIGLCSSEVGFPATPFADVFARARADGRHTVAHAGEEGDPSYVWEVLDVLHVERVDHGLRSVEDPVLMDRLVSEQVPLTVCPLSNVRLHAVPSLEEHPLARMLRAGALVSVNSYDPAYFGGYLDDNVAAVRAALGLTDEEVRRLAENSLRSSFRA